eukprot:scaffold132262_cov58-Attheya_sp.AAC.2
MNYGRNKWKFSELKKIPKGTWTTCQILEIQRLPQDKRDQISFPAGNKDKPCDEAVEKYELFDNPNAIAAWYLFTIETIGVEPKHDSRIKQDEGECLILSRGFETSDKCTLRWGNVSTSHAQLAGAMDSVVKGYMAQVPNRKDIYAIKTEVFKRRSGCHMCLDPRCFRHVALCSNAVNVMNEDCKGYERTIEDNISVLTSKCGCQNMADNYGSRHCLRITDAVPTGL